MKRVFQSILILLTLQIPLFANQLDKSLDVLENTNDKLKNYQNKIDRNEREKNRLLDEYKHTSSALKNTQTYNNQLEKIINSQKEELASLNQQIIDIEETQKNIFPLMIDMIKSLKVLIQKDTPFLLDERLQRVQRLENTLNRADIQTHEKYRLILEAFKIEYDYAKTIESYQAKIENKTYNLLRVGRVGLYYQSLDLKEYGYFNNKTKKWIKIDDSKSKSNIRKAIKIAQKQQNVDFLNLPFLAQKEILND